MQMKDVYNQEARFKCEKLEHELLHNYNLIKEKYDNISKYENTVQIQIENIRNINEDNKILNEQLNILKTDFSILNKL
jgi:hypothetical protein